MYSKKITSTKDLTREEWLKIRKGGIGGSDVAAIAEVSKYKTPLAVYLDKTGSVVDEDPSEAAYWGTMLEDIVAREFAERSGYTVQRCNYILQHPERPYMRATLDRLVKAQEEWGVLECKTANEWLKKEWEGDSVPDAYMLQVQHYLAVTGYHFAYIAALIGGQRFLYKRIDRNEQIIQYLYEIEEAFWKRVKEKNPPPLSAGDEVYIDRLYPPENMSDDAVELPTEIEHTIETYNAVKQQLKDLEQQEKTCLSEIKAAMKDHPFASSPKYMITAKAVTTRRADTEKLKKDGLFEEYSKETAYKRVTIKEKEAGKEIEREQVI